MLAPPGELLQLGLEQRLNRVKRATQSYMRDRARQATGTVTSYVVAAGLFATAGLFLIAACIVGLTALFRWVEMTYGLFTAFAVVGGILVALAVIFAVIAAVKLRSPAPHYPSLGSRLRVAIASPTSRQPDADEIDPDT
ncbi:MAG: phage holin family protein, partial [Bradyrhizobium sp.]